MNLLPLLKLLSYIVIGLVSNLVLTLIVIAAYYKYLEQGKNHKK